MKYNTELLTIELKERKLIKSAAAKQASIIDKKIQEYVPDNLEKTLNDMFELAFRKIFQNGVEVISMTFDKNSPKEAEEMLEKIDHVDGVRGAIGMDTVLGSAFPKDMVPDSIRDILDPKSE